MILLLPTSGRGEPIHETPADEPGVVIARLSVTLGPFGPGVTQREFEQALEDTPAHREAAARMKAGVAGERALFEARRLHGQARLDFLEQAARKGDAAAAAAVGELLDTGDGVAVDPDRASGYFRAAAVGGRVEGAHNLGAAYARGRGVRLDLTEALAWLMVARHQGDRSGAEAQLRAHLESHGRAADVATAKTRAATLLAALTASGVVAALPPPTPLRFDAALEIPRDESELQAARSETDPDSSPVVVITTLGIRRTWPSLGELQRAANRGEPAAMGALGRLLASGKLLPRDPLRALVWLERSADAGDVDAAQQLGDLYSGTEGIVADDAKAFSWFTRAAQGGSRLAMASVGVSYANGRGTQRDWVKALGWLMAAKHFGVDLGQEQQLRSYLTQHRPADIPAAEALSRQLIGELSRVVK